MLLRVNYPSSFYSLLSLMQQNVQHSIRDISLTSLRIVFHAIIQQREVRYRCTQNL